MTTSSSPQPSDPSQVEILLKKLEDAVRRGDCALARELAQVIRRAIAADEKPDRTAVENRVRKLMADLDRIGRNTKSGRWDAPAAKADDGPRGRGSDDSIKRGIDGRFISRNVLRDRTWDASPDRNKIGDPRVTKDKGTVFPVWFGTNRKPAADGMGFTGERGDNTVLGRAEIFVPENHRFGETGNPWWKRLLRFDLRDDRLRLQGIEVRARDVFYDELRKAVGESHDPTGPKTALLFLHGYNVSFEDAAIRAAQLGCDLNVPGVTAFFSWPSRGAAPAYPADEATIEVSEKAITDFLVDFVANSGAEKVHLIAHSMGNRGLLRALQRSASQAETRAKVKFGQIFLAAPDVDRDLFVQFSTVYADFSERTTLYCSRRDLAVAGSSILHDAPRAGYFAPYTVAPGVDTVAVPDFNVDLIGHSYFAQAEALLYDIHGLIRSDTAPGNRIRISPAQADGVNFWAFDR